MPTHPMTDQHFHEIQLSGKQLVFVFMSAVVVAVVIFLLGVSVGRGVRGSLQTTVSADAGATGDTAVTTAPPPAAQPKPGDLTYHDVLTAKDASKAGSPPAGSPATPPPSAPPAPATAPPQVTPPATPPAMPPGADAKASGAKAGPQRPAEIKPADPKTGETKAPVATGDWVVQVGGFNSRENADAQVKQLQAKGFSAFVHNSTGPGPTYRVRLGPFPERPEAERLAARLVKEGFTPLVTR